MAHDGEEMLLRPFALLGGGQSPLEQADLLLIEYQERGDESLLRQAAAELNFEEAARLRDRMMELKQILEDL